MREHFSNTLVDPKSERGNWKETLPEIAHEINIVNLTSDKDNAGLLDPFVIMKNVKDAESLAIDILTFLTGISSRDGEKFPVLRKAVRSVTQSDNRGLLHVIDELRREDTPISRNIADHIDSFTDYDFAHLLFSDGTVENAISLNNQLNIIQVADLVLPDKDTTFEEYTTIELLSVSCLLYTSTLPDNQKILRRIFCYGFEHSFSGNLWSSCTCRSVLCCCLLYTSRWSINYLYYMMTFS